MNGVNFIILAGGKGSRMKTNIPKVLYPIDDGRNSIPSFQRILNLINSINIEKKIFAVISTEIDEDPVFRKQIPDNIFSIVQKEKLGTGHAVQIVSKYLDKSLEDCVIIYGDHPLIQERTILATLDTLNDHLFCNLCFFKDDYNKYGKCILDDNLSDGEEFIVKNINNDNKQDFLLKTISIKDIVEDKDIIDRAQYLKFCNAGINLKTKVLLENINKIEASKETGEYYLTQLANLIYKNKAISSKNQCSSKCVSLIVEEEELIAFNSLEELAVVEKIMKKQYARG